jgi:hypothetical protein
MLPRANGQPFAINSRARVWRTWVRTATFRTQCGPGSKFGPSRVNHGMMTSRPLWRSRCTSAVMRALVVGLFLPATFVAASAIESVGEKTTTTAEQELVTTAPLQARAGNRRSQRTAGALRAASRPAAARLVRAFPLLSRILPHTAIDHRNAIGTALRL